MGASRYPVRWKLLAFIFLVALVLLFPWLAGQAMVWFGVRQGERVNPTIVASLETIREQGSVGKLGRAVEELVGNQGWMLARHNRSLTEKLLMAQWMDFGSGNPRPILEQFETSIEANPPGETAYRSRFPCSFRLRMFFLLDGDDRVVQVVEAEHPTCL